MTGDELVEITPRDHGAYALLALRGEIDLSNAGAFAAALERTGVVPRLAVDMSELDFIDSTGINILARHASEILDSGGAVYVVIATASIRKLFSVTGLDRHFSVVGSLEELPAG